jgi:hypothetical protein
MGAQPSQGKAGATTSCETSTSGVCVISCTSTSEQIVGGTGGAGGAGAPGGQGGGGSGGSSYSVYYYGYGPTVEPAINGATMTFGMAGVGWAGAPPGMAGKQGSP